MALNRIPLVAGNWKMNFDHREATYFVQKLAWLLRDAKFDHKRCEVALFPSFTSIRSVQVLVEADHLRIRYGAQSVSVTSQGAFTGDVSADMLAHLGCSYVIVGHSERRKYHPRTTRTSSIRSAPSWRRACSRFCAWGRVSRSAGRASNSISPSARSTT